jgi:hypothetical protein
MLPQTSELISIWTTKEKFSGTLSLLALFNTLIFKKIGLSSLFNIIFRRQHENARVTNSQQAWVDFQFLMWAERIKQDIYGQL